MVASTIGPDQLLRFESLGDNCEFGFVLRNLKCEAGSLFRWTSMKPEQLLAQLRAGFAGMYEFANLSPLRLAMVLDSRYGVGWHSDMKSELVNGKLVFRDDEPTRRRIHRNETRKLRYLLAKLTARARLGGVIFVIKANDGIQPAILDGIHAALSTMAAGAPFALLEMHASADPARIGSVDWVRPGLLRGYTSRFASYETAHDADMSAWSAVLARVLDLFPCLDWSQRLAGLQVNAADAAIQLRFPFSQSQDFTKPVMGDLRAGFVALSNGNEWCRVVEDAFRLHGPDPGRASALLRWSGIHPAGPAQLSGAASCPVEDAIPLILDISVADGAGTPLAERRLTVGPGAPAEIAVDVTPTPGQTLTVEIRANASRTLAAGERSVVDLSPLSLQPVGETMVVPVKAA